MYMVSRTETFAKLFFFLSLIGILMYIGLAVYTIHKSYTLVNPTQQIKQDYDTALKYILILRNISVYKFNPFYEGIEVFKHCPERNCYVTYNSSLLSDDITAFDAVVFNLTTRPWTMLPARRSPKQKYVFYGMSPSDGSVVCHVKAENLFNWTWTYKMSSEIFNPFIEVRDISGKIVAPNQNVVWKTDIPRISEYVRDKLATKRKALAWLVKNCQAKNNRMYFALKLKTAFKKHSLDFDIYGCGNKDCPNGTDSGCYDIIEKDYYFYLAYEQGFAKDYVTQEIVNAVDNYAVPIVAGGADYKKFLPENSFINARPFNAVKLAALVDHIIKNPIIYSTFHRWRSYYSIKAVDRHAGICNLCTLLNDKKKVLESYVYKNFRNWWYEGSLKNKCIPKGAESEKFFYSYLNSSSIRRG